MFIAYMIGFLIAIATFGLISALFIKLGAKVMGASNVGLKVPFLISCGAYIPSFLLQKMFEARDAQMSVFSVFPLVAFFLVSWFLSANHLEFTDSIEASPYGKAFVVTLIQCTGVGLVMFTFVFLLLAVLGTHGPI